MSLVINPGSGPVDNVTEENAIINIRHFIADMGRAVSFVRVPDLDYGEGRYAFLLWDDNECYEVQMPGRTLCEVRYFGCGQNPWDYPRLYVDGGSWLWSFALNMVFPDKDSE